MRPEFLILHHDRHSLHRPFFKDRQLHTKFIGVLVCSIYFDDTGGRGGAHDSSFQKVGKQSSYLFTQQNRPEMQGMKIDYLPWSLPVSLQPHVIASVARLQREEVS
jgi:hypothetical protein